MHANCMQDLVKTMRKIIIAASITIDAKENGAEEQPLLDKQKIHPALKSF